MKNLRIVGFVFFALFLTGVAFAQHPRDPFMYGDFSPEETEQHLTEFLPIYFNGQGFIEAETKYEIGHLAQARLVREDGYPYRDYFNAAVIYATPIGGVRHYGALTDTDAANAIRYATRAIKESPRMPYMYLIRGETYHRQGVPFYENGIDPVLDQDMALKAMADYEMVLELNPKMAPMNRLCALAESLKDKARMAQYCQPAPEDNKTMQDEIVKKLMERQKARSASAKSVTLTQKQKLMPIQSPQVPSRDLFKGIPRRAN